MILRQRSNRSTFTAGRETWRLQVGYRATTGRRLYRVQLSERPSVGGVQSAMVPDFESGHACEHRGVRGDDRAARCGCCRGDHQIVRAARRSLATHGDEKSRMSLGDCDVVGDHRDRGEYVLDERRPNGTLLSCSEQCTDSQLSDRDRRDGYVVLIGDHIIEGVAGPVGVDEKRRVEQETCQDRPSISTNRRMEASSSDQLVSCRWRRSKAFASAPSPGLAGSRWAMGLPRRTIGEVLTWVLDRVEDVGEVPGCFGRTYLGHEIRLSDSLTSIAK